MAWKRKPIFQHDDPVLQKEQDRMDASRAALSAYYRKKKAAAEHAPRRLFKQDPVTRARARDRQAAYRERKRYRAETATPEPLELLDLITKALKRSQI